MNDEPKPPAPHVLVVNTGLEGLDLSDPTVGARPDYELVEAMVREITSKIYRC